jgi:3-hydroxybutyryl-CoA dehydrogenase
MKVEEIRRIAVVGAGLMGHGIGQEFALAGYDVRLYDRSADVLNGTIDRIRGNLDAMAGLGMVEPALIEAAVARIETCTALGDAVANADYVVEAVYEDLDLKQRLFRELDVLCCPWTILASNTSTFLPSSLASATRRPAQVLVTHYFNPPHLLPLVEIVRGAETAAETVDTVYELLTRIGKRPALVQQEAPGFIGNRLQAALYREALAIVAQGIATPEDVDVVVREGFGRRLAVAGPFEVFDIAGLDLVARVMAQLFPEIDNSREVPPLLAEKVEQGALGVKAGRGFLAWTPETAEAARQRIAAALVARAAVADAE